jgi:hypothetical protein
MLLTEVVLGGLEERSMEGQEEKVREKAYLLCREYLQVSQSELSFNAFKTVMCLTVQPLIALAILSCF